MPTIATMIASGGAGNYPQTNEYKVDMSSKTFTSYPEITPALAIFTRMAKENAFNFQVELLERNELPVVLTCNSTVAAAGTSVTITSGYAACVLNSYLYNTRTGDIARVGTATPTTSTVTIVRSAGGTTGAIWNSGDTLMLLPTGYDEDADQHDPTHLDSAIAQASRIYNYVQLSRMYVRRTSIADKCDIVTGESLSSIVQGQLTMAFKKRMELGLYYGGRSTAGTAPDTTRLAGGFREFLINGTNYKNFGGALTESSWDDYLDAYFIENYDAGDVLAFCGPKVCTKIFQWGKARGRVTLDKQASGYYGFKVDTYDFNGKLVKIVRLPLLGQSADATCSGFLIDMNRAMMKVMDDMALYENIYGAPKTTEIICDLIRMTWSMLLGNEARHGMFMNA